MNLLIILGTVLAILIILAYIPVGIGAKYDNGVFVIVKISIFKFDIKLNKKVKKLSKEKKDEGTAEEKINKSIVGMDFLLSLLGDFRKFIRKRFFLEDCSVKITFGTSEASSTAVTAGALWGLIYNFIGLVDLLIQVKNPKVDINPVFNEATWNSTLQGIIVSKPIHIFSALIVFVCKYFKYKKSRRTSK